jgi:hypothetical protein
MNDGCRNGFDGLTIALSRVFDGTQRRLAGWRADYGFRLIWNLVTTVRFDYDISISATRSERGRATTHWR